MDFLRPASWEEALAAKAAHPTAVPIAGGTDVMVEINFDHRRPACLLDLDRIAELSAWDTEDARDTGGGGTAGVTGAAGTTGVAETAETAGDAKDDRGTGGRGGGRGGRGSRDTGSAGSATGPAGTSAITGVRTVRLGASVPYTRIMEHLRAELPGLALASHTVASPQIRNRGSVGGNLGTASPAGDAHPALLAAGAEVEAESVRGRRLIPIDAFYTGVKRNALEPDELIRAVHIKSATGPQQFSKVGTRNAMVIAVCAFGLALHPDTRTVRTGIGSAAPTPVRAGAAEEFLNAVLEEEGSWDSRAPLAPSVVARFAELVAGACNPIDDVRGTARYRRHAVGVLARRQLGWTWDEYRGARTLEGVA